MAQILKQSSLALWLFWWHPVILFVTVFEFYYWAVISQKKVFHVNHFLMQKQYHNAKAE